MKRMTLLVVAFVALLGVQRAKAWSAFEHGAIVYVAEQHLTPEAKAKCRYYLKHTLPYHASWMDWWRGVDRYKNINNPHTIQESKQGGTLDWGGEPNGRVMGHLVNAMAELGNGKYKNLPDSVVRQRIVNMIHYVPDMHCPVHIRLAKYPSGTRKFYRNGKLISYHGYWDGFSGKIRKGWTYERYAKEVDNISPKQAKKWTKGSYDAWGREIIRNAYVACDIIPSGSDVAHLTKEQEQEALALVDWMSMMAAYRLAHILNTIFKE